MREDKKIKTADSELHFWFRYLFCGIYLTNTKLLDCLYAVIETWMMSFQAEKYLMKTLGVAECFHYAFFLVCFQSVFW